MMVGFSIEGNSASWMFEILCLVTYNCMDKSEAAGEKLNEIMEAHGCRVRKRDKLAGTVTGSAEKLAMAFLTLGHDELAYLGEVYDLDPAVLKEHQEWLAAGGDGPFKDVDGNPVRDEDSEQFWDRGPLGNSNILYNTPVDNLKEDFNVEEGAMQTGEQVQGNVVAGAAASAIEYVTNRAGHLGRVKRIKDEMPAAFKGERGKALRKKVGI